MYKMSGVRRYLSPAPLRGFFFGARLTHAGSLEMSHVKFGTRGQRCGAWIVIGTKRPFSSMNVCSCCKSGRAADITATV
jgi:hypothetical protein